MVTEEKNIKKLWTIFYGTLIAIAVLFLLILFRVIDFSTSQALPIAVSQYTIIATLIGIPAALKIYANMVKGNTGGTNLLSLYNKAFGIRLAIIELLMLANTILFGLSRDKNYMWAVVVLGVILIFCKPSLTELQNLTQKDKHEPTVGE